MTKRNATILALVTSFVYLAVSVYLMLRSAMDTSFSVDEFNTFESFMLVHLPKIVFLFGLVVYFLVSIPGQVNSKNRVLTTPKPTEPSTVDKNQELLSKLLEQQAQILEQNKLVSASTTARPATATKKKTVKAKPNNQSSAKSKTTSKSESE